MKKILIICLCLLAAFACKKEGGSGKQLYLSKVFINDLLSEEYIYSSDMKVVRRNYYGTGSGQSVFGGFRIYEHENGMLSKLLRYSKDGALVYKKEFSYDASKKLTRVDNFSNDGEADGYHLYQYDDNQQLSKVVLYSAPPTKKAGEWFFVFDAQNNPVSIRRYYMSLGNPILFDSAHFTQTSKTIPAHWQLYEEMFQEFNAENTIETMTADSYYYYMSGGPPLKSTHTFTDKKYNGQGYLTSQHYKIEADNGLGITTINYNLKYEYIE